MTDLYPVLSNKFLLETQKSGLIEDMADADESFQDAVESIPVASEGDLSKGLEDATMILNLFFNNKQEEALVKSRQSKDKSIYHALSSGAIHFIQAFMTYDQADIETAIEVLKAAAEVCNKRRHKTTVTNNMVTKIVVRPNYNTYTEEEVHAELVYAESLLLRALVTFIQDENLMSFIKGGLRIRSCYQSYKECLEMLEYRDWKDQNLKRQFRAGIMLGVGTFNLLISTLPGRVLKLLEFVGFSGNRALGLKYLEEGRNLNGCVRAPLCSLVLILYFSVVRYALGKGCSDFTYVGEVVSQMMKMFPNSIITLFLAGRYENTRGNMEKAIQLLKKTLNTEVQWKKFQHLSYWEMAWCHMLSGQYRGAIPYVDVLCKENSWSKSTYHYMKAAQLMMCDDCSEAEKKEIAEVMQKVPGLKHHFSGKSIPLEKFFCKKVDKFVAQNNWLLCPVFEMMYVWNYFILLKDKPDALNRIIAKLERAIASLQTRKDWPYYGDNYCLATFLKGLCLRYMNTPLSAEECFHEVLKNQKTLKDDGYLVACASMELGFVCIDVKNYPLALQYLESARNEKAFFIEFRVHQGIEEVEAVTKKKPSTPTTPTGGASYRPFSEEPAKVGATKL